MANSLITTARGALARVIAPLRKQYVGSGYELPLGGGWIPSKWAANWWQQGYDPLQSGSSAVVYACIAAYAQTIAMCPATHWRAKPTGGGRDEVTNSALSRIMRRPNSYQSTSDFLLNLVDSLYSDGNAYALALRNSRFEVSELHLMPPKSCGARINPSTGDIFYYLGGNEIVERMFSAPGALDFVPQRDVLHIRLDCKRSALVGEPPLTGAYLDMAASSALIRQALSFVANAGRPSGVLQTELQLSKEQVQELRQRWDDQTQGINAGGTPILSSGLKWQQTGGTAQDAQLAEILQLADTRIAMVFRVPLQILGLRAGTGTSGTSSGIARSSGTESLIRFWLASGLGFALNHIEQAFERLFQLDGYPREYLEFQTRALQRSDFKDRLEGLAGGVRGGIYSINEARQLEDLPEVEYGDEPRVQQQDVPLSFWAEQPQPPAPRPTSPRQPSSEGPPDGTASASRAIIKAADRYVRRDAA